MPLNDDDARGDDDDDGDDDDKANVRWWHRRTTADASAAETRCVAHNAKSMSFCKRALWPADIPRTTTLTSCYYRFHSYNYSTSAAAAAVAVQGALAWTGL